MALKGWTASQVEQTRDYLNFLLARAKGELPTGAKFIREFVLKHPNYKQDSIVTPQISYDLMKMCDDLDNKGSASREAFIGNH